MYVIYDKQQNAIFGTGATVDEAWQQVTSETDRPTNAYDEPVSDDEWFAAYTVSGATQALVDLVNERGGDIAWGRVRGVACTVEEEEAADGQPLR